MLDLHIWGPAFGLPSIDPECVAAVAYMHVTSDEGSWRLIPSNDPSLSPTNALPALNHNGVWTSGYTRIVKYLTRNNLVRDIDAPLRDSRSPTALADARAFSAYLSSHAAPLLSLSLYVSSANWIATTRPLYSKLLPFPLPWTLPLLIRDKALRQTDYLGLAELDQDFDKDGVGAGAKGMEVMPETVRRHFPALGGRKTVGSEMTAEERAAIRLNAVVGECMDGLVGFMPSQETDLEKQSGARRSRGFFEEADVTSFDCLAFGYLSLMRDADVPRTFLRNHITQKSPRLSSFIDDFHMRVLTEPGPIPWDDPSLSQRSTVTKSSLSSPSSFFHLLYRVFDSTMRHIPTLGDFYATESRRRRELGIKGLDFRAWSLILGVLVTGAGLTWGVRLYRGAMPFGRKLQVWRTVGAAGGRFGEVGAMLGLGVPVIGAVGGMGNGIGGNASTQAGGGVGGFVEVDTDEFPRPDRA